MVGKIGRVTGTIGPGKLGEVMVPIRGGSEAFHAYASDAEDTLAPGTRGLAEGDSVRAEGMAEAESIKARADALAENQDAVIGQQLAEQWPAIVEVAAKPFGSIDQMMC